MHKNGQDFYFCFDRMNFVTFTFTTLQWSEIPKKYLTYNINSKMMIPIPSLSKNFNSEMEDREKIINIMHEFIEL